MDPTPDDDEPKKPTAQAQASEQSVATQATSMAPVEGAAEAPKATAPSLGTGNSAANAFKTNVWRLYQALDLTGADQIAVFDDGVGTSAFKPLRYLGLALGVGVKRNVIELYKFLCRNYVPGDRIYGFGFSRGAFTIRVLNGLINSQGLISFASEEELKRNAVAAYRAHRKVAFHRPRPWGRALRWARDTAIHYWNRATGTRTYAEISEQTQREGRGREQIPVHFLGLWDTVAAYGLPIDELTHAVDRWIWPMTFAETDLPPHVTWARQALSLDEARRSIRQGNLAAFWPCAGMTA